MLVWLAINTKSLCLSLKDAAHELERKNYSYVVACGSLEARAFPELDRCVERTCCNLCS
jgi:hypothetical protein